MSLVSTVLLVRIRKLSNIEITFERFSRISTVFLLTSRGYPSPTIKPGTKAHVGLSQDLHNMHTLEVMWSGVLSFSQDWHRRCGSARSPNPGGCGGCMRLGSYRLRLRPMKLEKGIHVENIVLNKVAKEGENNFLSDNLWKLR